MVTACGNNTAEKRAKDDAAPEKPRQEAKLVLGAERFSEYLPLLKGKNVGVIGNQTSILPSEGGPVHLVDTLLALDISVKKVFAPNTVSGVLPMRAKWFRTKKIPKPVYPYFPFTEAIKNLPQNN